MGDTLTCRVSCLVLIGIVDDWSDEDEDEDEEEIDDGDAANLSSDEIISELRAFFGANADKVKRILQLWNAYADIYNACCDEWTDSTDAYYEERAFKLLKSGLAHHELINDLSTRRHKSWSAVCIPGLHPHQIIHTTCLALTPSHVYRRYHYKIWGVASQQMRKWGDLWRFSTRAVEGRGGRLKHIGRRMICWRRRSNGKYKRIVRGKVVSQTYTSAPERQLMRAACSREERVHTQQRSRLATTGRNTLKRTFDKVEAAEQPALGGGVSVSSSGVKKLCVAASKHDRQHACWRMHADE